MKAGRALSQLAKNFRRLNCVPKICEGSLERIPFRPGLAHHPGEDSSHRLHMGAQLGEQLFSRAKAETSGKDFKRFAALRESVRLLFRLDLQTMLDPAQEAISVLQLPG